MSSRTFGVVLLLASIVVLTASGVHPAVQGFSGTYKGHQLVIIITGDGPQYTGDIQMGGNKFPLTGTASAGRLVGTFKAGDGEFKFTATKSGAMLSFETDGTTYICQREDPGRQAGPRNPLAGRSDPAPPSNPLLRGRENPVSQTLAAGGGMRFTRVSVRDPGINNIEALSFLIPAGWKTEGGIQWFPDYSVLANLLMKITHPQTGAAVEFLPVQNFTWLVKMVVPMQPGTNYLGNIICQPITDVAQFIGIFYTPAALRHLRNARIAANEDLQKVALQVARMHGGQSTARSGRVRYEYQVGGHPWEEDVYVTLVYTSTQLGAIWSVTAAHSFRAPQGQLDRLTPAMNTIINTLRLSPDWYGGYMYVQKLFYDRMRQGIRNARAISETISRNSEEIRQMFSDSYRQRCESQDRISRSYSEYIRGVETYRNPYEDRPVQLPSGYTSAWVNRSGEYILSPEAGFNPNVGSNLEWQRLERSP
jgi:hypothetical protein